MSRIRILLKAIKKKLPAGIVQFINKYRKIVTFLRINRSAQRKLHYKTPWVCVLPYSPEQSVRYIDEVYSDYLSYSKIPISFVRGKRVLEIGPGENLGVGLRFLADGAAFVASADRFRSLRSDKEQEMVYRRLLENLDEIQRATLGDAITFTSTGFTINESRYRYLSNTSVEEVSERYSLTNFDLIVSRAVLEHVADLEKAFLSMHLLLKPSGYMIHEVDFRDHGVFSDVGLNPLTFLTIRKRLWSAMSSYIGAPNRQLQGSYVDLFEHFKYSCRVLKIHIIGNNSETAKIHKEDVQLGVDYTETHLGYIKQVRHKLAPEFRQLSDEELLVAGAFFVARKP